MPEVTPDPIQAALSCAAYSVDRSTGWVLRNGEPIGTASPDGYIAVTMNGQSFGAHRVVWTAVHGIAAEHTV